MSDAKYSTDRPAEAEAEKKPSQKREPPKDAFSEMMARKKAKPETATAPHKPHMMHHPRPQGFGGNARWRAGGSGGGGGGAKFQGPDALGAYIADPTSAASQDAVVFHNDAFVAVHDKFPKASVHCLLLPRSAVYSGAQPLELFSRTDDAAAVRFLGDVRAEAARLARMVAADLERRFGQFSASDAARQAVLRGGSGDKDDRKNTNDTNDEKLPAGRNWLNEVLVGVHTQPSMTHLHVHVLSREMHSDKMRHRKHYNSFATPFFVGLDEFPLAADDARLAGTVDHIKDDLRCWRCGRNFGNKFAELKRHLDTEFEAWKKV